MCARAARRSRPQDARHAAQRRLAAISGTETQWRDDDLWIGSMWNAVTEPGESSHTFRLDLREVSTVGLDEARKHLVIEV